MDIFNLDGFWRNLWNALAEAGARNDYLYFLRTGSGTCGW